jgi:hypothetical protein
VGSRRALLIAAGIAFLLEHVVPFGGWVLYPFTLLATWVHETGHGLAALATGGSFERLEIFWDASGLAYCRVATPVSTALMALGGLWAPPFVGSLLLALVRGPRRARIALSILTMLLLLTLALWVRSPAGVVVVPLAAALLGWAAWSWRPERRLILTQLIALTLALDTLGRMLGYALVATANIGGQERKSDVGQIADALGGHHLLWGLAVIAGALMMLAAGAWAASRETH